MMKYLKRLIHLIYFLYRCGKEVIRGYSASKPKRGSGGHWYTPEGYAYHASRQGDMKGIPLLEMLRSWDCILR